MEWRMRSSWGLSLVLGRLIATGAPDSARSAAALALAATRLGVVVEVAAPLLGAGSAERLAVTAEGMANPDPTQGDSPRYSRRVDRSLPDSHSAQLLEELLESLLADFDFWFQRGLQLLELAPDSLLPPSEQRRLTTALTGALAELAAARALRQASPCPIALDMDAMAPWHRLMLRVWSLSRLLRQAGVVLAETDRSAPERADMHPMAPPDPEGFRA